MKKFLSKIKRSLSQARHDFYMRLAWEHRTIIFDKIGPPGRPSSRDMANYYSIMRTVPHSQKVLVLGTTPELRLLAADFASQVTVADFSLGMFKKTSEMVPESVRQKEERVLTNWLDLRSVLQPHSFDVILGDLVFRQITSVRTSDFVDTVHALLKKEGLFVTRVNLRNPIWESQKTEDIILEGLRQYRDKKIAGALSASMFRLYDSCAVPGSWHSDRKCAYLAFQKTLKAVETEAEPFKGHVTKLMRAASKRSSAEWTHMPREVLVNFILPRFEIVAEHSSDDYIDAEFYPLYVLKPK